ncbi:MAG: BrnA antitoxin family protein, partial [Thermomicrobia bacterium]|nr:BrnA antitoxin family protein [Thermomicrobia bacterium]
MSNHVSETNVRGENNPRSIPDFASDEEAQEFWATHDSTDCWDQMENVTATPPSQLGIGPGRAESRARKRPPEGRMDLVSLRFPCEMIEAVKEIAAQRHLPY